ncbi:16S rRNA processing protein RimM [Bacteriovorax sp. BSW11_IV]|uniref:ribosome maturation factor RimM n=1 Tax=Bacteriovorax sp. BSW11_IV TaxID=1353529 RepID=UPI00038A01BD|nr:ribosome maturation factor RimM [Bacteriovorax sp. BSW11_IV]EQC49403.1 16S rRNA processing protein RimM [Bacteriovorax sp. BSW11_IV]
MKENKLIELGTCAKPHGIKGAFSLHLESGDESILEAGMKLTLYPLSEKSCIDKEGEVVEIQKISVGNKTIAEFKGIADRNKVEAMIPFKICIDRSEFPEADDDEYYISDLIGLEVYEYETEVHLGRISKYYENSVQIILVISGKKPFEVPFVEHFVPDVDVEAGKIWVVVPEVI